MTARLHGRPPKLPRPQALLQPTFCTAKRGNSPSMQRAEVRLQRPSGEEGADAQTFREGRQRNIILGRKNTSSVFTSFVLW